MTSRHLIAASIAWLAAMGLAGCNSTLRTGKQSGKQSIDGGRDADIGDAVGQGGGLATGGGGGGSGGGGITSVGGSGGGGGVASGGVGGRASGGTGGTVHGGAGGQSGAVTGNGGTAGTRTGGAMVTGGATSMAGGGGVAGGFGGVGGGPITEPRPERPIWIPPFTAPLGAAGWESSTTPICDTSRGLSPTFDVWADERGVFATLGAHCSERSGYPCDLDGVSVQANDGSGWRELYRIADIGVAMPRLWGGLPDGRLLLSGTFDGQTGVGFLDGTGALTLQEPKLYAVSAFTVPKDAAGNGLAFVLGDPQLLKYEAGAWSEIVKPTGSVGSLWSDGKTVIAVGPDQTVLTGTPDGPLTALAGVPAGDYAAVWAFARNDVWLGNTVGQLLHHDGGQWRVYASGSHDPTGGITQMWGDAGVLYFSTRSELGRWNGTSAEILLGPPAGADYQKYPGRIGRFWGRSAQEVFVPLNDSRFEPYACGSAFMLWFDGSVFHVF